MKIITRFKIKKFLVKYLLSCANDVGGVDFVQIIGEPSLKLMKEMGEEEKKRIAQQVASLGKPGLKKMEQQLSAAVEENEV